MEIIMKLKSVKDFYILSDGTKIPCVGFGTWKMPSDESGEKVILCALENGWRHIDTAEFYGTEAAIGCALKQSDVPRSELFITSKVWKTNMGYDGTLRSFEKSIKDLQLDYIDMFLIHWPDSDMRVNHETWKAMERLRSEKLVKTIGVSNFSAQTLNAFMTGINDLPTVNQIEYRIGKTQPEVVEFCQGNDILVEAWGSLGRGKIFDDKMINEMAEKYRVSFAQLCLRFCLQNGMLPLVKSSNPERIAANTDIFNFEISFDDMHALAAYSNEE